MKRNRGPEMIAITAVIMALATIAVVLRLLSQKYSQTKFSISDYLIIMSLVSDLKEKEFNKIDVEMLGRYIRS